MVTTREMLETMRTNCCASGTSVQVGNDMIQVPPSADAYTDLRTATPEELLEAMIWSIRQSVAVPELADQTISFLRVGWRLARPGGWMHVAPMWLRESKKLAALDQ